MKKLAMCSLLLCCIMFFVASSAFAKKPTDDTGVYLGNGFPSGPHFNLNIHGKDPATFTCPEKTDLGGDPGYWKLIPGCEKDPITEEYGTECYKLDTSIFIPEYNCRFDSNGDPLPERIIVQSGKVRRAPQKRSFNFTYESTDSNRRMYRMHS